MIPKVNSQWVSGFWIVALVKELPGGLRVGQMAIQWLGSRGHQHSKATRGFFKDDTRYESSSVSMFKSLGHTS